jgi:hypothetical protein
MFPATRVGLVAVMILGLGLAAQNEPSREFVLQPISDGASQCVANAINELGKVTFTCPRPIGSWVRDVTRPKLSLPLEVYEGTRLIAAGIASQSQGDGSWLFRLPIPPRLFDGQPHFVNVRYGGTATAVDQAWGTIQCDPAQ